MPEFIHVRSRSPKDVRFFHGKEFEGYNLQYSPAQKVRIRCAAAGKLYPHLRHSGACLILRVRKYWDKTDVDPPLIRNREVDVEEAEICDGLARISCFKRDHFWESENLHGVKP